MSLKPSDVQKFNTYLDMAKSISKLSPDAQTKVGSIMLSPDNRIIASSYNGFVRGADDGALPKTRPNKYEYIIHSERNMIFNCAYEGIRTKDTTIFCTTSPCLECVRAAWSSGIVRIVYKELYHGFDNTEFYKKLKDINIEVDEYVDFTILDFKPKKEKQ